MEKNNEQFHDEEVIAEEEPLLEEEELSETLMDALNFLLPLMDDSAESKEHEGADDRSCAPKCCFGGISSEAIRPCLLHYTYLWLRNEEQFWFYPTLLDEKSLAGYRWGGSSWEYYGVSLQQIQSFTCVEEEE